MRALLGKPKLLALLGVPVVLAAGYFTVMRPKRPPRLKITGTLYVLPQPFMLNLDEGHYAKLAVALNLAPKQSDGAAGAPAASSPESAGTLPEEPLVREIVVNAVTGQHGETLVSGDGRRLIRRRILRAIERETDLKVQSVLFPELTVQ